MAAARSTHLPVNPDILVWARKRLGYSVDDAASRINVPSERVRDWELGEAKPTAKQARRLAKLYDRPFLEFFARNRPALPSVELVPDFRLFVEGPSEMERRALEGVQQWAEEQRANALSLIEELGERPPMLSNNLRFQIDGDPEEAAVIARDATGFVFDDQMNWPSQTRGQVPSILRDKIEEMGILVLRQNGLTKLRARGICLYAETLPVIVYGGEAPSAQAFTLAHEFGHVLTAISAISGGPSVSINGSSMARLVENWCNNFAASFLIPELWLSDFERRPTTPRATFDVERLNELANAFAVSRHAMLVRLVSLEYVRADFYWNTMRPIFLSEEAKYRSFGRAKYYGRRYVNNRGNFYTGLVLEAWGAGIITSHNAAEYMGISNLSHLNDIRKEYRV